MCHKLYGLIYIYIFANGDINQHVQNLYLPLKIILMIIDVMLIIPS